MKSKETANSYHRVLTIAGSDSGGGAGIQADLKTVSALGCYGASVITALTAQNTRGVTAIHAVPSDFVAAQMEAVLSDIGADAVKIGMLFSADIIQTVADRLKAFDVKHIVLDPVMAAQSGDPLIDETAMDALKAYLLPLAEIITPNLPEISLLLNRPVKTGDDVLAAAYDLHAKGAGNILIKGGHLENEDSSDWLYDADSDRLTRLEGRRIATRNNHGTGCTLSSAIAAFLAKGKNLETAVRQAKAYVTGAISAGSRYCIGQGHGPVHHFFDVW